MLIASRAATVVPILLLMSMIASACTESIFSDGEPVVRTAPPEPRNPCEETFAWLLTNDLGIAEEPPPTPTADALATVLNDCTANDLLEADDYFAFDTGASMERLMARRLFNGPDRDEQLVAFCESPMWSETRACETLPDQGP
jgi:hypothetical protein